VRRPSAVCTPGVVEENESDSDSELPPVLCIRKNLLPGCRKRALSPLEQHLQPCKHVYTARRFGRRGAMRFGDYYLSPYLSPTQHSSLHEDVFHTIVSTTLISDIGCGLGAVVR